jgi:hypothetical protein
MICGLVRVLTGGRGRARLAPFQGGFRYLLSFLLRMACQRFSFGIEPYCRSNEGRLYGEAAPELDEAQRYLGFCLMGGRSAGAMSRLTSADMAAVSGGVNNMCKKRTHTCGWGFCAKEGAPCYKCSETLLAQWVCVSWYGLNCEQTYEEGGCGYWVDGSTCSKTLICSDGIEGLQVCDRDTASGTLCPC